MLEEEAWYIFDWKYQDRLTGNTLDKPTLLLKRAFVKDTTFERKAQGRGGADVIRNIGSPSKQVKWYMQIMDKVNVLSNSSI